MKFKGDGGNGKSQVDLSGSDTHSSVQLKLASSDSIVRLLDFNWIRTWFKLDLKLDQTKLQIVIVKSRNELTDGIVDEEGLGRFECASGYSEFEPKRCLSGL